MGNVGLRGHDGHQCVQRVENADAGLALGCTFLYFRSYFGGTGTWSRIPVPIRIPAES